MQTAETAPAASPPAVEPELRYQYLTLPLSENDRYIEEINSKKPPGALDWYPV